jgi:hypothetical protein
VARRIIDLRGSGIKNPASTLTPMLLRGGSPAGVFAGALIGAISEIGGGATAGTDDLRQTGYAPAVLTQRSEPPWRPRDG